MGRAVATLARELMKLRKIMNELLILRQIAASE